jgi:hypothetical protein
MISIGDRVRAKIPTLGGWQGTGTVVRMSDGLVVIRKRGARPDRNRLGLLAKGEALFGIEEVECVKNG